MYFTPAQTKFDKCLSVVSIKNLFNKTILFDHSNKYLSLEFLLALLANVKSTYKDGVLEDNLMIVYT